MPRVVFTSNLQRHVSCPACVYRHGLAVDASGKNLALGSTTGGLWISANQGESWDCISTQLPPIYCVRFAD
jgi:hypothetical protein